MGRLIDEWNERQKIASQDIDEINPIQIKAKEHQKYRISQEVKCYREGWRGLWDHFKTLLTRNPSPYIMHPLFVEFYATEDMTVKLNQIEVTHADESSS